MTLTKFHFLKAVLLGLLFLCSNSVHAKSNGPLNVRTQNPLYLQFLAIPMEAPQTLNPKQTELRLSTTFSNMLESSYVPDQVNFDMELWRTSLQVGYGLFENFDVFVELPFISNAGGFLDKFVQNYHQAFNLPNGNRSLVPHGIYNYSYTDSTGNTLFNYSKSTFGLSDPSLRLKAHLNQWFNLPFDLAILGSLKLPLGNNAQGLSSGGFDAGISLIAQKQWHSFYFTTQIGGVVTDTNPTLVSIQNPGYFLFGQSVEWQISQPVSILLQLTGNTSLFQNVAAPDLSEMVLDLNIGVAGTVPVNDQIFKEFFYQFSFSEDLLATGPSVDFSLLFQTGVRF